MDSIYGQTDHHFIYIEDGEAIGRGKLPGKGIRREDIMKYTYPIKLARSGGVEAAERAIDSIDNNDNSYDFLKNNCENFAEYCVTGDKNFKHFNSQAMLPV